VRSCTGGKQACTSSACARGGRVACFRGTYRGGFPRLFSLEGFKAACFQRLPLRGLCACLHTRQAAGWSLCCRAAGRNCPRLLRSSASLAASPPPTPAWKAASFAPGRALVVRSAHHPATPRCLFLHSSSVACLEEQLADKRAGAAACLARPERRPPCLHASLRRAKVGTQRKAAARNPPFAPLLPLSRGGDGGLQGFPFLLARFAFPAWLGVGGGDDARHCSSFAGAAHTKSFSPVCHARGRQEAASCCLQGV